MPGFRCSFYTFAGNSPVMAGDPMGLLPEPMERYIQRAPAAAPQGEYDTLERHRAVLDAVLTSKGMRYMVYAPGGPTPSPRPPPVVARPSMSMDEPIGLTDRHDRRIRI